MCFTQNQVSSTTHITATRHAAAEGHQSRPSFRPPKVPVHRNPYGRRVEMRDKEESEYASKLRKLA